MPKEKSSPPPDARVGLKMLAEYLDLSPATVSSQPASPIRTSPSSCPTTKENLRPAQGEYQWKISGRYTLDANNVAIQDLCNMVLASESGRPVVDQSGLTGKYDFQLHWTPLYASKSNTPASVSDDAPDIFTAIQEQLGLELVPRKVPVKFVAIDHIEPPTEN